jgi:hypothetical protein
MIKKIIKIIFIIFIFLNSFTQNISAFEIPDNFQKLEKAEKINILKKAIKEIRAKIIKIQIDKITKKIENNILKIDFNEVSLKKPFSDEGGV